MNGQYWNGYQWVTRRDPTQMATHAPIIEDVEEVPADNIVGLDRLQMSQVEAHDNHVKWDITLYPAPGVIIAELPHCEIEGCPHPATKRVGDAINVCAGHVELVIEDGDAVVDL